MKICTFEIEAVHGIPFVYDNWYETMKVTLTDEQFQRYCQALKYWRTTDEWKNFDDLSGQDYFIHRDLPDVYDVIMKQLRHDAPLIWDERINDYIDQINIYTASEIWDAVNNGDIRNLSEYSE